MKKERSFLLDVVVPMTIEGMEIVHKYLVKPHLHKVCPHVWTGWDAKKRKCTLCGKEERNVHP